MPSECRERVGTTKPGLSSMSDPRVAQAREEHRLAREDDERAARHRSARNRLIRQLRTEDRQRWTYPALGAAVGCSPELVAAVVQGRTGQDRSMTMASPGKT